MKRGKFLASVMALLLSALALSGCAPGTPSETSATSTVTVIGTRDFGHELMFDSTLEVVSGTSAMAALEQVTEVETAYGGGFVEGIDGVASKASGRDWFIYVNGIQTNVGASGYALSDGDIERWDYHGWRFRQFTPAIVADYPEPFLHGYEGRVRPTVIAYDDGLGDSAERIRDALEALGVADARTCRGSELADTDKQSSNLVVVGTPAFDLVSEMNKAWNRLGLFVRFEGSEMIVHDSGGEVSAKLGAGCGVVQATQSPWNPKGIGVCENVVWMVSGVDDEGVRRAADILTRGPDEIGSAWAVVVADGQVIRVP
jgi:hypothetical protein